MHIRRRIGILLLLAMLLGAVGCGADGDPTQTDPTVANIFTTPVTDPEKMSLEEWQNASLVSHGGSLGFSRTIEDETSAYSYYEYTGGEAVVTMKADVRGMEECGFGVFLFLDGQIQPYRTEEEDTYSYMHTFYLPDNQRHEEALYFIPVCGEKGDTLEMQIIGVYWPDYFLDQAMNPTAHMIFGHGVPFAFLETPPAQALPAVKDSVISTEITQSDVSSSEIEGWTAEQLRNNYEFHYYLNDMKDGADIYGFSPQEPAVFRFEIWGNPAGKYSVVIFVDNEPASIAPEDLIFIQTENGKKTVAEVTLDLSDFDGSSVIYPVLLARNYYADGMGNGASGIYDTQDPYYLSDAMDLYDMMGWSE